MAVQLYCPDCNQPFSVSASLLGEELECPRCGHSFPSQSREDIFEREARLIQEESREVPETRPPARPRARSEESGRIHLPEAGEEKSARVSGELPRAGQPAARPERHFEAGAPSRHLRLRALSELFLVFAYLGLLMVGLGAGLTIYLKLSGVIESLAVMLIALVGWGLVGGTLYLVMKLLAELVHLFADIGDQQRDQVSLLLDVRDNTDEP